MTSQPSLPVTHRRLIWGIRILLALAFSAAGGAKLGGVPVMIQLFDVIGFGQWFRFLTGFVEVVGAILLLVPSTGFFGGLVLSATMVGAVVTHIAIGGNAFPAVALGGLSAFVAWRLRPESMRAAT